MLRTIYKFPFEISDSFSLKLPIGSRILFVEKQKKTWLDDGLEEKTAYITAMWCEIDPNEERTETREFIVVGTGQEYDSRGLNYIGSIMLEEDRLLWHLFERMIIKGKDGSKA